MIHYIVLVGAMLLLVIVSFKYFSLQGYVKNLYWYL